MSLEERYKKIVEHYAQMAMHKGSIDHARHMVMEMEKDKSRMWVGLGADVRKRINELKAENEDRT
jgi:hypothetical protein